MHLSAHSSTCLTTIKTWKDFPGGSVGKNPHDNTGDMGSIPGLERFSGEGMATHSNILAGKSHGQRTLASYSPWDHKESDTT